MSQNLKNGNKDEHNEEEKSKVKEDSSSKLDPHQEFEFDVPPIPEVPKSKKKLTVNSPGLSNDLLEKMKKLRTKGNEVVLVNCERCQKVIPIAIPKKIIEKSELPVIPVSFVHKDPQGEDLHCITIHLDHDFDVRRQRISEVVISSELK